MGNNFKKMTILHKGRYYEIDKKPEFHQAACKHKFIKGQIVKTIGDIVNINSLKQILPLAEVMVKAKMAGDEEVLTVAKDIAKLLPTGRLPKKVNLCKKCGKVKVRNN